MPRMSKVIMIYNSNAIGQNLKGGRSVKSRICTVSLTGQISVTGQKPVFDHGHAVTRPSRMYALK